MSALPAIKTKPVPKVALVGVDAPSALLLRTTFQQLKIEAHALHTDPAAAMHKTKYEGCVLPLDDHAQGVLEAVRTSPRNRQITILGLSKTPHDVVRYAKFGINAVLKLPLDRQDTMRAVRSIHLLILHELRRYIRLPIVVEVLIETNSGNKIKGMTRDISYGGMSVNVPTRMGADTGVNLKFTLPNGEVVKMPANVLWFHPPDLVGLRYESTEEPRQMVRRWIDGFLEIS